MKLEEVIERLKDDVKYADLRDIVDDDCTICFIEDIETVLQELEHLQKENEDKKTYEFGLIVGTKRERDWWQNKIREKIEKLKPQLEETDKRTEKAQTQEERVVLKCIGIRLDERIKTLQDLLKEE